MKQAMAVQDERPLKEVRLNVPMTDAGRKQVAKAARKLGMSASAFARMAISEKLEDVGQSKEL